MTKRAKPTQDDDAPRITGGEFDEIDDEEVYQRAVSDWRKIEKRIAALSNRRIEFERGPVAIVFMADLHLGASGTDYPRLFREAEIVARMPNTYLATNGDLLNNFILPKLTHARAYDHTTIPEEWALVRRFLRIVSHKLILSVSGNHERWTNVLDMAGDYFADVLKSVKERNPMIYDANDALVRVSVGKAEYVLRMRHSWQSNSIYNVTHGIERLQKFDQNFFIGVGAHSHASGVCRGFNAANGVSGMAILCGTYKRYDHFAREKGFAQPNGSTAQTLVLHENGHMLGVEWLEMADQIMRMYARGKSK